MLIAQSTAITIKFGPFLDSADGNTVEAGLTIQKADVRLSKNGGNMVPANADQGVGDAGAAYDEIGYYDISLDATDTNTCGRLQVMVHEAGALAVWQEYMVIPSVVYNSIVAGTDNLQVDTVQISSDGTAADNLELDYDGTGYNKANSTIGTTTTNTDMRGTDNAALAATALSTATWTNARAGYLDELNAPNLPADVDAILLDTGTTGVVLADDAITSAKYDEATAYPLASADAGLTEVARTGADGDTLETLSDQIDAVPTATENADGLLRRDWTAVAAPAARSVLNALRFLRNRWRILAGVLTVYEEDDASVAWTGAVNTAASDPVDEIDPT